MAERRLFEDVADTIRRLILDGPYPPGTRLPGERELSERFEVSRVTIREAEIALQATGWIHIGTGARLAMRRHFNRLLESMLDETEERALVELRRQSAESRQRYLLSAKLA